MRYSIQTKAFHEGFIYVMRDMTAPVANDNSIVWDYLGIRIDATLVKAFAKHMEKFLSQYEQGIRWQPLKCKPLNLNE